MPEPQRSLPSPVHRESAWGCPLQRRFTGVTVRGAALGARGPLPGCRNGPVMEDNDPRPSPSVGQNPSASSSDLLFAPESTKATSFVPFCFCCCSVAGDSGCSDPVTCHTQCWPSWTLTGLPGHHHRGGLLDSGECSVHPRPGHFSKEQLLPVTPSCVT